MQFSKTLTLALFGVAVSASNAHHAEDSDFPNQTLVQVVKENNHHYEPKYVNYKDDHSLNSYKDEVNYNSNPQQHRVFEESKYYTCKDVKNCHPCKDSHRDNCHVPCKNEHDNQCYRPDRRDHFGYEQLPVVKETKYYTCNDENNCHPCQDSQSNNCYVPCKDEHDNQCYRPNQVTTIIAPQHIQYKEAPEHVVLNEYEHVPVNKAAHHEKAQYVHPKEDNHRKITQVQATKEGKNFCDYNRDHESCTDVDYNNHVANVFNEKCNDSFENCNDSHY